MRSLVGVLVVPALLVVASGCSVLAPASSTTATGGPANARVAQAQATHEYTSATPPPQTASGASGDPTSAIRVFANEYINWNAGDVAGQMRALAAESIGQARSATQLAAAQTSQDYELQRGGIANAGTVEAIAPVTGHRYQYAVVTREQTTASNASLYQGLHPAWHVALATVTQLSPGRWVVSGWQPES